MFATVIHFPQALYLLARLEFTKVELLGGLHSNCRLLPSHANKYQTRVGVNGSGYHSNSITQTYWAQSQNENQFSVVNIYAPSLLAAALNCS